MKLGAVADVHVGNFKRFASPTDTAGVNSRCRLVLDTFGRALSEAVDAGCSDLVVLGDLFDSDRPTPQVITQVQDVIAAAGALRVHLLLGNHDQTSARPGDHAIGPLAEVANVRVWETPSRLALGGADDPCEVLFMPFRPGNPRDWLPGALAKFNLPGKADDTPLVLCLHMGIYDDETSPILRKVENAVPASQILELAEEHNISLVLAGDWHHHRTFESNGRLALQVGTLCPTSFSDDGLDNVGGLAIYDSATDGVDMRAIPGPRFFRKASVLPSGLREAGYTVFVKYEAEASEMAYTQGLAQQLHEQGLIQHYEVVPNKAQVETAAREAASAARDAATLETALQAFVEGMPLPDGVDRTAVLNRARSYL